MWKENNLSKVPCLDVVDLTLTFTDVWQYTIAAINLYECNSENILIIILQTVLKPESWLKCKQADTDQRCVRAGSRFIIYSDASTL